MKEPKRKAGERFQVTCPARTSLLAQTLASLAAIDWNGAADVVVDDEAEEIVERPA